MFKDRATNTKLSSTVEKALRLVCKSNSSKLEKLKEKRDHSSVKSAVAIGGNLQSKK